ncbi:MarR family winged helix-turn-helix transcriptional regulator [Dactylosporangium sp. CA-092794]|uniref:MarR family winged helix-turn-helix transcriptional regulator n=1 Tax=Dactylosporangium sp. CA-092794 TaxID=3239929 RepID=UPI003D8F5835
MEERAEMPGLWWDGLPYVLWRAQQAVHRRLQDMLEDLGVTMTQLGLVVHLHDLGVMSASDLARLFRLTPQSVNTALIQLDRLGWVRRVPHPVHRRVILYELTETGLAGVAAGRVRMAEIDGSLTASLPEQGRDTLIGLLRTLTIALEGDDSAYRSTWPIPRPATAPPEA